MQPAVLNVSPPKPGRTVCGPYVQIAKVPALVDHTSTTSAPSHVLLIGADRVQSGGRTSREHVVALAAGTPHRTASRGKPRLVVYLDPRRYRQEDLAHLAAKWRHVDPAHVDLSAMFEDALRPPRPHVDRRLERAFDALGAGAPVQETAAALGVSANWLSRLMVEATGSSPRAWRSYLRLHRAVHALAAGRSVTFAAHEAGFADAAHLTRTTRRFLGTTPRVLTAQQFELHADAL